MSRLNDLEEAIVNQNHKGGIPSDRWMVFLLTHIALSLATIADAMTRKDGAPTIEPERKTGKWIKNDSGAWSCNRCQSWIPDEQHYYANYCLYCGAKMEVEHE